MQYKLKITTDDDFDIKYDGKPTKYCDSVNILFNVKSKYNPKKVLKILDRIEIIKRFDEGHYKHAQTVFSDLKKAIENGDEYFSYDGNYSFIFNKIEEDAIDYIVNI